MAVTDDLPDLTEQRIDSEVVHDGGFIRLERDTVRTPAGESAQRYVVRHCGAVGIAPLFANNDLLLVHQYRYAVGQHSLEIPAGKLDVRGENPLECAKRELSEETGHSSQNWEKLYDTLSSTGFTDERLQVFVARDIKPSVAVHNESGEFTHPVRVSLAEAQEMVAAGKILEARTQIVVLWLSAGLFSG